MDDDLTTLAGLQEAVWSRLMQGVERADAPARTFAFATRDPATGAALRMVVLRAADRDAGTLTFWTNRASSKYAELAADPAAQALVWDAGASLQVRLSLSCELRPGPDAVWEELGPGARQNYAQDPEPGDEVAQPEAVSPKPSRDHFVEVLCRITGLDVLHLGPDLHRRARFDASGVGRWIAP